MKEYFKWVINHKSHNYKLVLVLLGIVGCIVATPAIIGAYNEGTPLIAAIMGFVAIYGFVIAMAYQPYTIYKRLKRMGEL